MISISNNVEIPWSEIQITAIRAQGAGGQHVNKVSTAIHLKFDIHASSLPEFYKQQLDRISDHHITKEGIIIIKAQKFSNQHKNREDAIQRLVQLIQKATTPIKKRRPTRPTYASGKRRLESKAKRSLTKNMRQKPRL